MEKKYSYLEAIVLFIGTIYAWSILYGDFQRFFQSGGTLFSFVTKPIAHPALTPCFYGAFFFLIAFIWSLYIIKIGDVAKAIKQKEYLLILLIGGTIFSWSSNSLNVYKWIKAGGEEFVGCTGLMSSNPFITPCFVGAGLFAVAMIIAIIAYKDQKGEMQWSRKYIDLAIIAVLIFTAVVVSGYLGSTQEVVVTPFESEQLREISPLDAFEMIQNNIGNEDFVILDVRTRKELSGGYIENSINLDFWSENFRDELDKFDKNKTYLIYCHTGVRGGKSLRIAEELGFIEAYSIEGGIVQWEAEGFPIVK